MEKEQSKVAESKSVIANNTQIEKWLDNVKIENCDETIQQTKKILTPYQKYKLSKNQNGKKYFEFYNDIKVYTHNIYDW